MACQICGAKSGFYPLCNTCFRLRDEGKITMCEECGIWKEGIKPLCKECWLKKDEEEKKKSKNYEISEEEKEEDNFRDKYPPKFLTEDGHKVRSKAEQNIDNWLYHKGIVHAYERRVPIEEKVYCDFFVPEGQVWIEFWGIDEESYNKRKMRKKHLYQKYNKNLIELDDKDIERIDDIMPVKLRPFFSENHSFD